VNKKDESYGACEEHFRGAIYRLAGVCQAPVSIPETGPAMPAQKWLVYYAVNWDRLNNQLGQHRLHQFK